MLETESHVRRFINFISLDRETWKIESVLPDSYYYALYLQESDHTKIAYWYNIWAELACHNFPALTGSQNVYDAFCVIKYFPPGSHFPVDVITRYSRFSTDIYKGNFETRYFHPLIPLQLEATMQYTYAPMILISLVDKWLDGYSFRNLLLCQLTPKRLISLSLRQGSDNL